MSVELVTILDERGIEIYFVDWRIGGMLVDSRWFPTEKAAREFLALGDDR